jgi:hypothetical protein
MAHRRSRFDSIAEEVFAREARRAFRSLAPYRVGSFLCRYGLLSMTGGALLIAGMKCMPILAQPYTPIVGAIVFLHGLFQLMRELAKPFGERSGEREILERMLQLRQGLRAGNENLNQQIAAQLNREGLPARRGPWTARAVARILRHY